MKQIMFSGIGGQGVILAANILARSAVKEGFYSAQSQAYGSESRGTTTRAEVIVAKDFVDFPHVEKADYFVVMAEAGLKLFKDKLSEDAVVIYDGSVFKPEKKAGKEMIDISATELSLNNFEKPLFANIIMIGALIKKSGVVSIDTIKKVLKEVLPEKAYNTNIEALELGYNKIS